ncbi:TonB-dependent receptor domain-containing protein [Polaromonas sp.]|uniref:TonB-dependent receptor domain-containing protein n=1 Tax=Polaromonas sp. TaxID=1869339 RepID=UPI003C91B012
MKTCVSHARLAALPLALAAAFPVFAQSSASPQLKETVVTATRTERPVGEVVADVTIIDREVIERSGAVGLVDVLARVPGIEITRNGGTASNSSVFVRGGENRHTAVLIDGVRVDAQTTSGGTSWNAIPLAQIERIEIVRGPTSAVYGSDAVAGVIQIFTKKGQGPFAPVVSMGYGSHHTRRMDFSASGSVNAFDYSFGVSEGSSKGFNARPIAGQNPDADGYKSSSANAKLGLQLAPNQRLQATVLQSRVDSQYDSGLTRDYRRIGRLQTAGLQLQSQWTDRYSTSVGVSQGTDEGEEVIGAAFDQTKIKNLLWQNEYKIGPHLLSATVEERESEFLLTTAPRIERVKSQSGLGLGYAWSEGAHTVQLNTRHDKDSEFGGKSTGSAAYAIALSPQWKLSASAGTSFRVPTLYQRFSQYGVTTLRPESGRSAEIGLKYAQGSSEFGVVAYQNKVSNLLTFLSGASATACPRPAVGCYSNTAQAQYDGVTFSAAGKAGRFGLYGSLDIQNPRDVSLNKQLARRARHHATLGADTRIEGWTLAADLLLSGKRFDTVANTTVLPGYGLLNVSASTALSKEWKLLAKLDNLTDRIYQTASGYAMAGRTAYVGVTWAPL